MDDFETNLMIFGVAIAVVVGVGLRIWLVARAVKTGRVPGFLTATDPQLALTLQQLQLLIAQAQATKGRGGGGSLSAQQLAAVQAQFNAQMQALQQRTAAVQQTAQWSNHMQKEKYDLFVGNMLSNAAAAGIDTSGIRY
jgi:hypothetical protein